MLPRIPRRSLQCYSIVLEYCKIGSLSTWLNECAREQIAVPLFNAVKIGKDLAAVTGYQFTLQDYVFRENITPGEDDRVNFTVTLTLLQTLSFETRGAKIEI